MLSELPPEILLQIVADFSGTSDFKNLSQTCRRLHAFVDGQGWKLFVDKHFPSFTPQPYWRDAAHALTTLSRNWDRRAFLSSTLYPNTHIHTLPAIGIKERWNKRAGQTMGYQPVIDSYEEHTGNSWASRKEVVAWGAGAEIVIRRLWRGNKVMQEWRRSPAKEEHKYYDASHCRYEWLTHQDPRHLDGRDDITALHILRPEQRLLQGGKSSCEEVVVGRASGELTLLSLSKDSSKCFLRDYATRSRQLRSATVSGESSPLLACCLGDGALALFDVHTTQRRAEPLSEVQVVGPAEKSCRTWSTCFLTRDKIAVGRGVSDKIVHVYDVTAGGLSKEPLRVFGCGRACNAKTATSAYPIVPVGDDGRMFFSGGYDGKLR